MTNPLNLEAKVETKGRHRIEEKWGFKKNENTDIFLALRTDMLFDKNIRPY
jgi:hypothetical protein